MRWRARLLLPAVLACGCTAANLDPVESQGSGSVGGAGGQPSSMPPSAFDIGEGLVAHWTFDEAVGERTVHDVSAARHDGTLVGGTFDPTGGRFKGALTLAEGQRVEVRPSFPPAKTNFSVSVWVRFAPGDARKNWAPLISTQNQTGGWEVNAPGSNSSEMEFAYPLRNGNQWLHLGCPLPGPNTWIHLTSVIDGDRKTATLYLGSARQNFTAIAGPILPGSELLYMGGEVGTSSTRVFQGTLDEIRVYDRALSPAEVAFLDTSP